MFAYRHRHAHGPAGLQVQLSLRLRAQGVGHAAAHGGAQGLLAQHIGGKEACGLHVGGFVSEWRVESGVLVFVGLEEVPTTGGGMKLAAASSMPRPMRRRLLPTTLLRLP